MESPVIVENCAKFAQPVDIETGFPFDDTDYDSQDHFQSRLNDIAARHPEFATHFRLDDFPSLRRKRHGSGSVDPEDRFASSAAGPSHRFADHSFPSGFNRFPFSRKFEDNFAETPHREEKPPEVPKSQEQRGRKPNPYLPQHLSNTVDLGQKQPPVEGTRSQRSMSAPPENRQSSTSRENEPSNPPQESQEPPTMGKNFSRQPTSQPKERIIPIHVEGRDDPVMPKNPNISSSAGAEKVFSGERVYQPQYSHQKQPDPQAQYRKQMYDQFVPQTPPTKQSSFARQQTPPYQQQAPPPPQQQQQQHTSVSQQPQQRNQTTPPPSAPISNDPLDKIKSVRSDVMELMTQVEKFQGTRKDKFYLYLDEMLTRNLLKLDDIETDGKENIRLARKEAIKCIQTCINNLEARAQAREMELKAAGESSVSVAADQTQMQLVAAEVDDTPKFTSEATLILSNPETTEQQPKEVAAENMEVEPPPTTELPSEKSTPAANAADGISETTQNPTEVEKSESSQTSNDSTQK